MDLADLRLSYTKAGLAEADAHSDPFRQFALWMEQAIAAKLIEPNAMTLATCDTSGQPNARTVLLKGFDEIGFVFYTNYESRKAREIQENARVSLLFYWADLERQVRVAGRAERVSDAESETYFASRPVGHQIGAWVSEQSSVIAGREIIEHNLASMAKRFEPGPVPRPPYWGGFRVRPAAFEFWQGRANRLHDRLEYVIEDDGHWTRRRLSP
jgi:pyridoxamine 5'-phosphate oxidase